MGLKISDIEELSNYKYLFVPKVNMNAKFLNRQGDPAYKQSFVYILVKCNATWPTHDLVGYIGYSSNLTHRFETHNRMVDYDGAYLIPFPRELYESAYELEQFLISKYNPYANLTLTQLEAKFKAGEKILSIVE